MLKSVIGILLILAANISFAHDNLPGKNIYYLLDTVPVKFDAAGTKTIDSNVLIVLNGKVLGTIREIKNLNNIISPDSIKSINIFKDSAAFSKYGDKGKSGVIEISAKNTESRARELYFEEIKEDENIVFEKAEVDAAFPGGQNQWLNFLKKNLNPDIPTQRKAPRGTYTVVMQFIVDKSGKISDLRALTNHGYGMEEECIRVLKLSPNWLSAIQNGRNVKAYKRQPISFVVSK